MYKAIAITTVVLLTSAVLWMIFRQIAWMLMWGLPVLLIVLVVLRLRR